MLKLLRHPNIIELELILPPEDREFRDVYILFELMDADLSTVLRSPQALSNDHYRYFMVQLLHALAFLHASSVIHRDIKPKNVLVNSNCTLKVSLKHFDGFMCETLLL